MDRPKTMVETIAEVQEKWAVFVGACRTAWLEQCQRSPVLFHIRLHWLAFKLARNFARRQLELERRTMEALAHRERQARLAAIKERDAATRPRPQYPY